jgi:GTPase SAR1 family protein
MVLPFKAYILNYKFEQGMHKNQNYDYLIKLLVIGNSGVGKTNMLLKFC